MMQMSEIKSLAVCWICGTTEDISPIYVLDIYYCKDHKPTLRDITTEQAEQARKAARDSGPIDMLCSICGYAEYGYRGKRQDWECPMDHGYDSVSHPKHYTSHPSGIECIQITRHMNFNLGNAIKYIWRCKDKNGIEDLQKAIWYLQDEIKRLGA